jgi:hypothetical protein
MLSNFNLYGDNCNEFFSLIRVKKNSRNLRLTGNTFSITALLKAHAKKNITAEDLP